MAFLGQSRIPKWIPNRAWKAPELRVERVVIDGAIDPHALPPLARGVRALLGYARGELADLLVVGSMGYLRELGPTPCQQLCDWIFVVGRGVPVIAASTWRAVGGEPKKLYSSQVVFHKAASELKDVVFRHTPEFRSDNVSVMWALDKIAALPNSKWRVSVDKSRPGMPMPAPAKGTELVEIDGLASLGDWILKARVLQRWGCRGFGVMKPQ